MKKLILGLGELLLDYGSLLYLLFIICVAVYTGSIFILFTGLVILVLTLFLLYLLVDIRDKLREANETLSNLLLVINNQSFSFTGIKEDTGVINSILTDDPKLFENMNKNLISINNLLSKQSMVTANNSASVDTSATVTKNTKQNIEQKQDAEMKVVSNKDDK